MLMNFRRIMGLFVLIIFALVQYQLWSVSSYVTPTGSEMTRAEAERRVAELTQHAETRHTASSEHTDTRLVLPPPEEEESGLKQALMVGGIVGSGAIMFAAFGYVGYSFLLPGKEEDEAAQLGS